MNSFFSSRDVQVKSMEQMVRHAEKYLGEICSLLASYTRKTAKLRDKADQLVVQLFDFSRMEDPELQVGLKNLAEDLAMVQDYRQAQVERLEIRVVAPLKAYGDIVKNKRAEVNAQKASNNAQHSVRQLEETITTFQRQKLEDIKKIFTDFITVEMLFHAKALEVYTHTYHNLEAMNTQKHLELFSGRIKGSDSLAGHLDIPQRSYFSPPMSRYSSPALAKSRSLWSTLMSATSKNHNQHGQYPATARRSHDTLQRQRGVEETDLEEEEEDEDEEDQEEEKIYESEIEGQRTSRQSYAAQYVDKHICQK